MQGTNDLNWTDRFWPKSPSQRILIALLGGSLLTFATLQTVLQRPAPVASVTAISPQPQSVVALGRLEPRDEMIRLAPTTSGSRLAKLLVRQGDRVKTGQVIAWLDSHDRLQAALEQAKRQVEVAQTKLAQVKAGAKQGEINAQKASIDRTAAQLREDVQAKTATVARLEAELANAQTEYQRYETLYQSGAISASLLDSKQLTLDATLQQLNEAKANRDQANATLTAQLNEAKATLDRIAEVRPVDVAAAQAEVNSAMAAVQQAQAELELAYVRSPRDGQILKVHTWAGELVGAEGIADLGQTSQMDVVAEVYESDIQKIRVGQTVEITSAALNRPIAGTVKEIGLQVLKKGLRDTDPTADTDARIVEVKIALDAASTQQAGHLTNLEVTVKIPLQESNAR